MVCNLLRSPKAAGVEAHPGKERGWHTLLFSGCGHRQGQPERLLETDRAGHPKGLPWGYIWKQGKQIAPKRGVACDRRLLTTLVQRRRAVVGMVGAGTPES